jgi:hypothetical protein
MKTKLLILLILICATGFAQSKMGEKQAISKSHIDFTKEYLYFTIHGLIEIDGHTFLNDTCKNPVIFSATIDGISITKDGNKYEHRGCGIKGCLILHLKLKADIQQPDLIRQWYDGGIPNVKVITIPASDPLNRNKAIDDTIDYLIPNVK